MSKVYEIDWDKYPDGIAKQLSLSDIEENVWERGCYLKTDEGTWYELFVNNEVKTDHPNLSENLNDEDSLNLQGFYALWLGDYADYCQITFFVPNEEKQFTFEEMTNIFL